MLIIKIFCNFALRKVIIRNMSKTAKITLLVLGVLLLAAGAAGYVMYQKIYSPNIFVKDTKYLYIPRDADFQQVKDSLYANFRVEDEAMLEMVAGWKNYPNKVKPGRYEIKDGMSNNALINMLRSGNQKPVNVTFNNIRTLEQLSSRVSRQIDVDSVYLLQLLKDDGYMSKYGFDSRTCYAMFIPDTYQFFWNTSAEKFIERMHACYCDYWTAERENRASQLNLTKLQVSTLASIVQCEQSVKKDEQPKIAGLYLNRLKIGMTLQSCPTVIYACGNWGVKRVTNAMLEVDSPYNTYKNVGLPPSPICFAEQSALDAVLNYDHNDYLYMCAKSDFSGYHNFSKTYDQHLRYAREFQRALSQRGIH